MREPTIEEIDAGARIQWDDEAGRHHTGFACWYPQMGGYVGKCIVQPDPSSGCFEAYIWHDGEFPFSGADGSPARIHHCCAEQFISFGQQASKFVAAVTGEPV